MAPAETGAELTALVNQCDFPLKLYVGELGEIRVIRFIDSYRFIESPPLPALTPQPQYGPTKIGKGGKPKRW